MTEDVVDATQVLALRVRNLRNLRRLDLEIGAESRRILVTGPNGAGKTTILEALYLLARGRSFRGRKAGALTTDGAGRLLVEARLHEGGGSDPAVLVFERNGRGTERRLNGLAIGNPPPREMPLRVKLVGENPQALLEGEPTLRRALLDWNLFHVEHQFGRLRLDLRRVLAQRNAALRQNGFGVSMWDLPLVELADRITRQRNAFVRSWSAHFLTMANKFPFLRESDLSFDRGWPKDMDLINALEEGRATELMRGQTMAGPHRADLALMRDGRRLRLSRGQAKVAVCLLQLAAERVHRAEGLPPTVWLLDDIDAELDPSTAGRLWGLFDDPSVQHFATRVANAPGAVDTHPTRGATFHVEHGILEPSIPAVSRPPLVG